MDDESKTTESFNEPGPWGPHLLTKLQEAGVVPAYAQRVIIDIPNDGFVMVHCVHANKDGDKMLDIIPALVKDAEIVEHKQEGLPA